MTVCDSKKKTSDAGIIVSGITKCYGRRKVLQDISFGAQCGQRIAVVGRNGCGKTTLMQILAGVMKPDSGNLSYFSKEPLKDKKFFREFCGYVPQENPLLEELSVRDNLKLWGVDRSDQYEHILDLFRLRDIMKTEVGKLSGGMKRRLGIACALAQWPPILILDEPTAALDIYYKQSIEQMLQEYCRMNGIVIMTTHDESEILRADRCMVMNEGRMTEIDVNEFTMTQIKEYIN